MHTFDKYATEAIPSKSVELQFSLLLFLRLPYINK